MIGRPTSRITSFSPFVFSLQHSLPPPMRISAPSSHLQALSDGGNEADETYNIYQHEEEGK
jgi:hypothetical protein